MKNHHLTVKEALARVQSKPEGLLAGETARRFFKNFTLFFAIAGVIVVNGTFYLRQEYCLERALDALQRLLPQQVKGQRDGRPCRSRIGLARQV